MKRLCSERKPVFLVIDFKPRLFGFFFGLFPINRHEYIEKGRCTAWFAVG